MDGVSDVSINFGASKITVFGEASLEELEKAGAFENLKITPENQRFEEDKEPFLKKHSTVIGSLVFLLIGFLYGQLNGEENMSTILAYATSMIIGGYRLFSTRIKNLIRLQFDMKTLMTIAVIGAAFIGEWGEGATLVNLFAISEALESYSMDKARQSIRSLMDIAPKEALIRRGTHEFLVEVDDIKIGDIMIVKPGQKIALDGIVVKGLHLSINRLLQVNQCLFLKKSMMKYLLEH